MLWDIWPAAGLLSGRFLLAVWLVALCCGSCVLTHALCCGICCGICCGHFCVIFCVIFGQQVDALWMRSGCFLVAFWLFALCCGCFAPTNALRCGIFCEIFYGICCGICLGIFGLQLPAVWLRAGGLRAASGMLSVNLLFAVAVVLLGMLLAVAYFVEYVAEYGAEYFLGNIWAAAGCFLVACGLRSGCFLIVCSWLWLLRSYEFSLLWYILWNMLWNRLWNSWWYI
jgi:hypothetical protein